jgi:hypothetical protein
MSHHPRRTAPLFAPAIALVVMACSSTGVGPTTSAPPSSVPTAAPTSTPVPAGTVEHKTGSTDIVLRYSEGGGFVMPAFQATQAPYFTLYGDGTVVFRNPMLDLPPAQGSVAPFNPLRTATLTEDQVQSLLVQALGEGGLAAARARYENPMVADAGTAEFTIDAGGITKTVSIYALGMESQGGADAPARAAFQKLAARLSDFDQGGTFPSQVYAPTSYRAILLESPGIVAPDIRDWPWPGVKVDEFKADADPNGLQFPHRTMTADEIGQLKLTGIEGGFQGLVLKDPAGKLYTLSARPLLPGDAG